MNNVAPDIITLGPAIRLLNTNYLADVSKIGRDEMVTFLNGLLVPTMEINGVQYCLAYSLEHQLFERLRPAGKSFSVKKPYPIPSKDFEDQFRDTVQTYGTVAFEELQKRVAAMGVEVRMQLQAQHKRKQEAQMLQKRPPVVR